jgi:hypothetical protein
LWGSIGQTEEVVITTAQSALDSVESALRAQASNKDGNEATTDQWNEMRALQARLKPFADWFQGDDQQKLTIELRELELLFHDISAFLARVTKLVNDVSSRARMEEKRVAFEAVFKARNWVSGKNARRYQVWELVLGVHQGSWQWILAASLVLYNVIRGVLTYYTAPLRDLEERTWDSPAWGSYGWLWWLHCAAAPLLLVSTLSGIRQFWHAVTQTVIV